MYIEQSANFKTQVQDVTLEIQDLLQWLEYTDLKLSSTKTVWGMPDSTSERLSAHLVMLQATIITQICRLCMLTYVDCICCECGYIYYSE